MTRVDGSALSPRDGGVLTTSREVFGDKAEKVIDVRRGRGGGTPVSASPEESRSSSLRHKDTQQCAVRDPEADYHVPAPDPGPPASPWEDKLLQSMSLTWGVSSRQSE